MRLLTNLFSLVLLSVSFNASATVIFSEDFESGLSVGPGENWERNEYGIVVVDPIEGDAALTFSDTNYAGDLFSHVLHSVHGLFSISFDYLGTCGTSNCGGFFYNSGTGWDGTADGGGVYRDTLEDTGAWVHVSFLVDATNLLIKLEDWNKAGPAGDAYFDNIVIASVPEPGTLAIFGLGLAGMGMTRRRKR